MTRARTPKVPALVVTLLVAMSLVSACSTHPGQAATVGSDRIGDDRLDQVATALCAAQKGSQQGGPKELSSRAARQGALGVLINGSLSRQFGESRGAEADQEKVSSALAANAQTIASLPASSRAAFRDTLEEYARGQLMLISIGGKELAQQGKAKAPEEQAFAEGTKLRDAWAAKNVKVSVDPRYGTFRDGALQPGSGSLSTAVSSKAREAAKQQPSAGWVSSLPASQKCR